MWVQAIPRFPNTDEFASFCVISVKLRNKINTTDSQAQLD